MNFISKNWDRRQEYGILLLAEFYEQNADSKQNYYLQFSQNCIDKKTGQKARRWFYNFCIILSPSNLDKKQGYSLEIFKVSFVKCVTSSKMVTCDLDDIRLISVS